MSAACRPQDHLIAAGRSYPSAWSQCDLFRADRGTDMPDWPQWCYLPMGGWYAIVSAELQVRRLSGLTVADVARLAALGAWRVTKGIYRFDTTLRDALLSTPIDGDLPHDVLYRLPEWCVYIETPGMVWRDSPMHGCFVHLEHDANSGRPELRFLLDCELALVPMVAHLGPWSLSESIARAVDVANVHMLATGGPHLGAEERKEIRRVMEPLTSLVLYLCSEAAEIGDGSRRPQNPVPKRTKRGERIFAVDHISTWDVGVRLGAALRRAEQAASNDAGGTHAAPRPHIRRAHWHGFRTGPIKTPAGDAIPTEKRPLSVRWLPPIPVNVGEIDELPATIRSVK